MLPSPHAPLPTTPPAIVQRLRDDERALRPAILRWGGHGAVPRSVTLLALDRQRLIRKLGFSTRTGVAVMQLRPAERDDITARTDLVRLAQQSPPLRAHIRVGRAAPPLRLLAWYREAERRFGVRWQVLAAINFVESDFDKFQNTSTAGAQGPMQFEPSTWQEYGMGGDIHDPHDAILAAANYLHANGATHDERTAIYDYNHSPLYVDAVEHLAHRITVLKTAFLEYYAWQVYVRTAHGYVRVTGPR
jgi:soluble lytic murein transglycosylase-like protein